MLKLCCRVTGEIVYGRDRKVTLKNLHTGRDLYPDVGLWLFPSVVQCEEHGYDDVRS